MELKEELQKALTELRKTKERKFNQSADLIINLQKFDVKKSNVNLITSLPHRIKEKKITGFFETKNKSIETITKSEFKKYSEIKELKKLVKSFDFFVAQASLMPQVATVFGRVLGPAGKMPSPQLGIILNTDDKTVNELKAKVNDSTKIKVKEPSVKLAIGKWDMKDEEIIENILTVYNALAKEMPRGKENLKNLEIKFTMTKPVKIKLW